MHCHCNIICCLILPLKINNEVYLCTLLLSFRQYKPQWPITHVGCWFCKSMPTRHFYPTESSAEKYGPWNKAAEVCWLSGEVWEVLRGIQTCKQWLIVFEKIVLFSTNIFKDLWILITIVPILGGETVFKHLCITYIVNRFLNWESSSRCRCIQQGEGDI